MPDAPDIRAIVIRGQFTTGQMAQLVALIRAFDERNPERIYEITAVDAANTALEIAERVLHEVMPDQPGRTSVFAKYRRN